MKTSRLAAAVSTKRDEHTDPRPVDLRAEWQPPAEPPIEPPPPEVPGETPAEVPGTPAPEEEPPGPGEVPPAPPPETQSFRTVDAGQCRTTIGA